MFLLGGNSWGRVFLIDRVLIDFPTARRFGRFFLSPFFVEMLIDLIDFPTARRFGRVFLAPFFVEMLIDLIDFPTARRFGRFLRHLSFSCRLRC